MNKPGQAPDLSSGRYWVAKLPLFVYDAWKEASAEKRHFADIKVETIANTKRMRLVLCNPEPGAPKEIPLIVKPPTDKSTFIFAELPTDKNAPPKFIANDSKYIESSRAFKLEEPIKGFIEVKPEDNENYRKFNLQRLKRKQDELAISVPVKSVETDIYAQAALLQEDAAARKASKKEAALKSEKRSRADAIEMYKMLSDLFAIKPHWKFGELAEETKQPHGHLKNVLKTYCIKDELTDTYSLRPKESIVLR